MEECKSVSTPMGKKEKLQKYDGADPVDEGWSVQEFNWLPNVPHSNQIRHHVSCKYPLQISKLYK